MFFLIKPEGNGGGISNYHKPCKFSLKFVFTSKDLEIIVTKMTIYFHKYNEISFLLVYVILKEQIKGKRKNVSNYKTLDI